MSKAVYPGTFDPITLGHLDVIERAAKIVDHLVVGVLENKAKKPLFTVEERAEMITKATAHLSNVTVETFEGLQVDFAEKCGADAIVRGLRAVTDFEYELQMFHTNRALNDKIDTLFFNTKLEYAYLSSSAVKEVAAFNGSIKKFVPDFVEKLVVERINADKNIEL